MIALRRIAAIQSALLCGLAIVWSPNSSIASEHNWQVYGNGRFEYTICFPADVLTPQPEADNGGGRAFLSNDGAKMLVWGTYNTSNLAPAAVLRDEMNRIIRNGGRVTYKASKPGWYVLSGTQNDTIFYQRGVSNSVRYVSFRLTYPKPLAAKWNPVAARISACLNGEPE